MIATDTQIRSILKILKETYSEAKIALSYGSEWELLVAVVLSAQCTDIMVNKITRKLFEKYRMLEDYIKVNPAEFEADIRQAGFFRNKAKNILASARIVKERFGGKVPRKMGELLTLPGVARKTANIILGNAFGVVVGIAVDTHVSRLSQRLRLVDNETIGGTHRLIFVKNGKQCLDYLKDADAVKIEQQLMRRIPQSEWFSLTYRIIDHGRAICKAINPNCSSCPVSDLCPSSRV